MGQKIHPSGFRLGITQDHKSTWYANFNQYANILKEDNKIRAYIENIARFNHISNVKISRNSLNNQIQVIIETAKPGILTGPAGVTIQKLSSNLKKQVPLNSQLLIKVCEITNVDLDANLIAIRLAEQLEKRIGYKYAIREALRRAQNPNINGIKIRISGRLNGIEIARSEWFKEGQIPLQTLSAKIDYATAQANTYYGILGIKIWLFKNKLIKKLDFSK